MYMSQVCIDPSRPRLSGILRNQDYVHKTLLSAFNDRITDSGKARKQIGLLYRIIQVNGKDVIYVYSSEKPEWKNAYEHGIVGANANPNNCVKDISALLGKFQVGACFRFEMMCNPTTKAVDPVTGKQKRVFLNSLSGATGWINDRAESRFGFCPLAINDITFDTAKVYRGKQDISFGTANYVGILMITDREKFLNTFQNGCGREKCFGMGMMLLQSVSQEIRNT